MNDVNVQMIMGAINTVNSSIEGMRGAINDHSEALRDQAKELSGYTQKTNNIIEKQSEMNDKIKDMDKTITKTIIPDLNRSLKRPTLKRVLVLLGVPTAIATCIGSLMYLKEIVHAATELFK
jgi:hypothetical protein